MSHDYDFDRSAAEHAKDGVYDPKAHTRYLAPWGSRDAVEVRCTCEQSHGVETYPSFEAAMRTGRFDAYVPLWVANDQVSRRCRDYAERGTGIEQLRGLLRL